MQKQVCALLDAFTDCLEHLFRCPQPELRLSYTLGNVTITGTDLMARMTTEQTIDVSVDPRTESGNPATIDGDASFTDVIGLGTFEQLTPLSARYTPTSPGVTQIVVIVDADLDVGEVREIRASGPMEVLLPEEEATTLEVVFGEPVDR